jgi:cytochrome c-type biogenesis protein
MSSAVAFAFAAGALSTVNPCGFAVLPAFIAYYLGQQADAGPVPLPTRVFRGVGAGAALSAGFAAVFTVAGLLLAAGLRLIIGAVPWIAVAVGAGLIALGLMLLAGRKVGLAVNANGLAGRDRGVRGLVLFGAAYALASLSCTVAVLLAVVGQALAASDLLAVVAVFAAYSLGAASVLVLLTVSAAVASGAMARLVRRALPYVGRVSGAFLVLSGAYLLAYWLPQLAGQREGTALSRAGGTVAGTVTQWLQGRTSLIALLAAAVVAAALVFAALRRGKRTTADDDACCAPAATTTLTTTATSTTHSGSRASD